MLSIFPSILFLAPFSAFLIRIALAAVLGYAMWAHWKSGKRGVSFIEGIVALAITLGSWTQIGAIIAGVIVTIWLWKPHLRPVARGTALLSLVLCLSLLVTGAGALAFDLPL